ncbi:MAG: uroporphyrinogen III synthase/methyltransferase [Candidatus Scalindua rubra]|uniref:uroporphyrinogen-III C-methyltransferase n=1 Tax=Candidatus Scalindua rubra TaxID=1872076 RepID=A0A1E3XFT4_9BACT|nr:MAG: uroporphyrinogen III synthase/methyltransferase [Candidatus Scalindua rubra]
MSKNIVYLVGSGPGDPGLITVKGLECIKKADVIIYDYLVNTSLLKKARDDAELIYVGKQGSKHTMEQEDINRLIVNKAGENKIVTRLKGGDPYVFGRGGEEAIFLKENNIPFEVIPGITAAIATPAYAGIPVTHRSYTSTFGLITGHEDPTKDQSEIDWEKISTGVGTLTFYMGIKNLPNIVEQLIKHGRSKDTPVAVIRWGTTPAQKTVTGTLSNIVEKTKDIKPPAITIVGEVVKLRNELNWFETKPLFSNTIIVTRSRDQASEFSEKLADLGANVLEFPTINIINPDNFDPLDKELKRLESTDWIIFTSVNGVESFFNRLLDLGGDIRDLKGVKICAIGPATAEKVKEFHIRVDCQPPKYVAESVVEVFKKIEDLKGKQILMPRADIARSYLPEELQKLGADVVDIIAYKTVAASNGDDTILEKLKNGMVDIVTFTSSSTVRNFVKIVGKDNLTAFKEKVQFASIGPITTKTAEEMDIEVSIKADEYTIPGLVKAIVEGIS